MGHSAEMIQKAIAQENGKVHVNAQSIPEKYQQKRADEAGVIEHIRYPSKDYFLAGKEITKEANVYLPYGYSRDKKYNVLYLMHGIGGDEAEWGMVDEDSLVKRMMDNLIYYKEIEPFIVVTPNGRSTENCAREGSDYNSFYVFGKELRPMRWKAIQVLQECTERWRDFRWEGCRRLTSESENVWICSVILVHFPQHRPAIWRRRQQKY